REQVGIVMCDRIARATRADKYGPDWPDQLPNLFVNARVCVFGIGGKQNFVFREPDQPTRLSMRQVTMLAKERQRRNLNTRRGNRVQAIERDHVAESELLGQMLQRNIP